MKMSNSKKRARDEDAPFRRKKNKRSTTISEVERNDESTFRRKKNKKNNSIFEDMKPEIKVDEDAEENLTGELLDIQTVREGMLLFGCVTEIKHTFFVMSLPGCLSGIVSVNNISNAFSKSFEAFSDSYDKNVAPPSISSIIKVGMVFPCKVIQISQDSSKQKTSLTLSINPQDINADLRPSSLYSQMVLYASVCSIEDHGYVVDVGNKYIQGFLPRMASNDTDNELNIGEVIPTCIKKINVCNKTSAKIQLSKLDFNEEFPDISVEDIKLSSVLPGAKIRADVIDIKHPFVFLKFLCFDACANVLSLGSTYKAIAVGSTIQGTVLYIHPITRAIYLMLNLKPSPDIFHGYFGLKKYNCIKNLKFQYFFKNRAFYKISKGTYGFINKKDLPSLSQSTENHIISKACVLSFHYMDNLVQMSAKPSLTEKNIILAEDVQIGDIYDAIVKNHVHTGMLISICPGLFGFVRRIHMSDVFVTKPEDLHPVGSKIKCRVLSTDGKGRVNMTCKESLMSLQDQYILSSYDGVQEGQLYTGVIVQITDAFILVLFFNDIQGIVESSNIPKGSVFFEGQTVTCQVLECNTLKMKLKLSLKTENCSLDDLRDVSSGNSIDAKKNKNIKKQRTISSQTVITKTVKNTRTSNVEDNLSSVSGESSKKISVTDCDSKISVEAMILKVKGSQLNILLNNIRGRVHITQLGCVSEGIYPLREFSAGQKIEVYVIGEHIKKKKNYLEITHRNLVSFKECALKVSSLPQDLIDSTPLIGFVKEVGDVCAVLWLSPTKTGVLDYLHFSENLKEVKKLRQQLKIGLSLEVFVFTQHQSTHEKGMQSIALRKIEKKEPQVGKNILGLVQVTCMERGLILKLPFGYHGVVAMTDLSDKYVPLHALFNEFRTSKFVLCHVLEVNHQTKYCELSLRKSRVYGKKIDLNASFCPEITSDSIVEGDIVKGFVRYVSDSAITVIFGRNLEGKLYVHNCTVPGCGLCNRTKKLISKHPLGSVVEVVIEKKSENGKLFILSFTDSLTLKNTECNRLHITEDISWDEID